jgi:hypothetical protein
MIPPRRTLAVCPFCLVRDGLCIEGRISSDPRGCDRAPTRSVTADFRIASTDGGLPRPEAASGLAMFGTALAGKRALSRQIAVGEPEHALSCPRAEPETASASKE